MSDPRPLISICIPVYNEADNLPRTYARLCDLFRTLEAEYRFEIVMTDNHSTDASYAQIEEFARKDARVRGVRFSRNFGYQKSILTGYRLAQGACAIQLDADLQDPPEMVPQMLAHWRKGYKVVYGIRRDRKKEGFVLQTARRLFYRLIDFLSDDALPHDAGDFRLIDRVVLEQLKSYDDQTPYLRGQIASMGFAQVGLPYQRDPRIAGETKFSFGKLVGLAADGIFNHSVVPLRLATFTGLVLSTVSALVGLFYLCNRLFFGSAWPAGFATLALLLLFLIGLNALFLGLIGEYVGRIYLNVKRKPLVIVEEKTGDKVG